VKNAQEQIQEHPSILDKVKDASRRYAGYGYMLGDASLVAYGIATKERGTVTAGLLWGLGGAAMGAFGKKPSRYLLKEHSIDLARHLHEQGITIPEESALSQDYLQNNNRFLDSVQRFAYKHPTELLNTIYGVGASIMAASAVSGKNAAQPKWSLFASGALILAGALSGLFIQEKTPDHATKSADQRNKGVVEWFKEKPLRISGGLYLLNNIPMAYGAYKMHTNPAITHKHYRFRYLTAASFVTSNILLTLSSKDQRDAPEDMPFEALYDYAADIVARTPDAAREATLEAAANYLAHVAGNPEGKAAIMAKLAPPPSPESAITMAQPQGRIQDAMQYTHTVR
jgi:hypothetical protein